MTVYEKIFNARNEARIEYRSKGGFIRLIRYLYWDWRFHRLKLFKANQKAR
jgi:hypothetical protein